MRLKNGDKVRLLKTTDMSTSFRKVIVPFGTIGVVISDLNEQVERDNKQFRENDTRHRELALVRFDEHDAQDWLTYGEVELES